MNNYGFCINELSLRGKEKLNADLLFKKGLNLITGASDTGKTFVFECIDYILGSSTIPKEIKEAEGYDNLYLEIKTYSNSYYVIQRNLSDKKIFLYDGKIKNIKTLACKELKNSHDVKKPENISSFLLDICKIPYKQLLKNEKGVTNNFSFRNVANLFMINERRIFNPESVIFKENGYEKGKCFSSFRILLTGNDDSDFLDNKNLEEIKQTSKAKLDFINQEVSKLNSFIENLNNELINSNYNKSNSETYLKTIEDKLNNKKKIIYNLDNKRLISVQQINRLNGEILLLSETNKRFQLLKKNYISDIQRLDFIDEANYYLNQIPDTFCPICDNKIENPTSDIETALKSEGNKLKLQLNDLEKTIFETDIKIKQLKNNLESSKEDLNNIQNQITNEIQPTLNELNKDFSIQLQLHDKHNLLRFNNEKLEELLIQQKKYTSTSTGDFKVKVDLPESIVDSFLLEMKKLLIDWKLGTNIELEYDSSKKDIIFNGKSKRSVGKGYAALLNSAFIIAISNYCIKNNLPHPKTIIIDSPLTTYKEKDQDKINTKSDEVPLKVKNAFFKSLIEQDNDIQFIIFDNIIPDADILQNLNHIHFSKNPNIGRYGYIPIS